MLAVILDPKLNSKNAWMKEEEGEGEGEGRWSYKFD